jgi:hypothetical protein
MRKSMTALAVISLAAAAMAGLPNPPLRRTPPSRSSFKKEVSKGKVPTFGSEDYTLRLEKLESRAKVELAERGEKEYTVKLEGKIAAPKGADAIAVTRELKVLQITDAEKRDLREPTKPRSKGSAIGRGSRALPRYQLNTFASFRNGVAEVEIPQTKLRRNPYTVDTVELAATVILAEERQSKKGPAIVMERPTEIVPGVRLRIMALKMTAERELTVVARFTRPKAGPVGPFLEQVWVLGEGEEVIAHGRWGRGDPFSSTGTLTAELSVPSGKTHKQISFGVCTKYSKKPLRFQVTGIFQR